MTEAEGLDTKAVLAELQARVRERFESGQYPPDLERELAAHYEDLLRSRRLPGRYSELMRRLDDAAKFSPHRIQLVSSLPGGRRLHGLVAAAIRRQVSGILAQDRLFAVAVRDVLTEIVASLPEEAAGSAWWDVPAAYQEELYGSFQDAVAGLAPLVEAIGAGRPVLVLETGRGELEAAFAGAGIGVEAAEREPLAELEARADGTLGGVALRRVLERLEPPAVDRLVRLAARKLRPGGRFAAALRPPASGSDPALGRSVDAAFLAVLLRDAGFAEAGATGPGGELVTATR